MEEQRGSNLVSSSEKDLPLISDVAILTAALASQGTSFVFLHATAELTWAHLGWAGWDGRLHIKVEESVVSPAMHTSYRSLSSKQ